MAAAKDVLGRRGEDIAAAHLQARGLVILERNWRCRLGELDLIATDSRRLVVCEVKTRSAGRFGPPAAAVDRRKRARIRQATQAWLSAHRVPWCEIRFDVLSVVAEPGRPVEVRHYEAAF
jgi:putative endonuclease